jgi:ferric-dicitrate binding protein FerR (iron transport regulator)
MPQARRDALKKELDLLDSTMRAWSDWMADSEGKPRASRQPAAATASAGTAAKAPATQHKAHVPPDNENKTGFVILAGMALLALGGSWCAESLLGSNPGHVLLQISPCPGTLTCDTAQVSFTQEGLTYP